MADRLAVRKTYKLWIGGAFVRSESGRYDEAGGVNFPRASRKDVRDAVAAARKAAGPWAARTAYNRGQILYRAAEALESRAASIGRAARRGRRRRSTCCCTTPAGPTSSTRCSAASTRSRRRSCRSRCPSRRASSGSSRRTRRRCSGWSPSSRRRWPPATSRSRSCPSPSRSPASIWPRSLGVSDVPGGVVNLLSGRRGELGGALGAHRDLNAIVDAAGDAELSAELDRLAAETIKRVRHGAAATHLRRRDGRRARAPRGGHRAEDRLAPRRRVNPEPLTAR